MASINSLISGVAQTALKYWLRRRGLRHSASNETALVSLIERLIKEGDLTLDELKAGVCEIEEHGGKQVYLKQLADLTVISSRRSFERRLDQLGMQLGEKTTESIRKPSKPVLNYAVWEDNEIRLKYSETHTHLTFKKRTRDLVEERRSKFIVMSVEPATGFMRILMDPAGDEHRHLNDQSQPTAPAYLDYYLARASEIFGATENFDLIQPVTRLLAKNPRVFDVRQDMGLTTDNFFYSFSGRADVRQGIGYKAAAGSNPGPGIPELIRGWWLESVSANRLERNLWSVIKTEPGMIQFRADCLATEVDYAISTIRSI